MYIGEERLYLNSLVTLKTTNDLKKSVCIGSYAIVIKNAIIKEEKVDNYLLDILEVQNIFNNFNQYIIYSPGNDPNFSNSCNINDFDLTNDFYKNIALSTLVNCTIFIYQKANP